MRYSAIRGAAVAMAAAGIVALGSGMAAADGGEGAPMAVSESPNIADFSGIYVGARLGGSWSDISWTQDLNVFTAAGALPSGSEANFSPSGFGGGGILGG